MDNITEKIAKVTDLGTYTNLTPEHLKKLFDEIGGSPEKLRTILNLWFVPDFKPTFYEPQKHAFSGLQDIDFLDRPDTEQTQRPLRLIDLETGNLVDVWNTSPLDSYCMLSHRWKGDEITLSHIRRARAKHMERSRSGQPVEQIGDIQMVLEQSKLDIIEQEDIIISLLGSNPDGKTVANLLEMRLRASEAKDNVNRARQDRDTKKSKAERCRMEKDMFDQLIAHAQHDTDEKTGEALAVSPNRVGPKSVTSEVVDEAQKAYLDAQKKLDASEDEHREAYKDAEFLRRAGRLGDAVDEMVSRLQLWKSAIKLDNSMKETLKIFQTKLFPKQGAYYMWSDTCCIDKPNYGELSQSLSLMGDWYGNAAFCLVHLDTTFKASDAIDDWRYFKGETDAPESGKPTISSFETINCAEPEWANRAWTLQELVMSKMAYFTNSVWQPLSRPIENLGYTYPLIPFVELYTRGDITNMYLKGFDSKEAKTDTSIAIRNSDVLKTLLNQDHTIDTSNGDRGQVVSENFEIAVHLISILQSLGFTFPADMTAETAIPEMSRAVYLAAWNLSRDENESNKRAKKIFEELQNHVPSTIRSKDVNVEVKAQDMINLLLAYLVAETKSLIVSDRQLIAGFGQVNQLESWKQGTIRSGFPAERVLQLACRRKATAPVDHVYCLMGILNVRFQSFSAEGYPKALSRLLDEVIITHNDVSVFNWAGVEMGSPVRGRSMYPASHKAYGNEEDRGRRYNMMIAAEEQKKRREAMVTYQGIIRMLRDAIDCVKVKGRKDIPFEWVEEISVFIKTTKFGKLQKQSESIGKILRYIKDSCVQPAPPPPSAPEKQSPVEPSTPVDSDEKSGWGFSKPSLSSMRMNSGLKTPKISGFGIPSISKPSFGRHHSEPVDKIAVPETAPPEPPKPAAPEVPEWMRLDRQVKEYLKSLKSSDQSTSTECTLPIEIEQLEFKTPELEDKKKNYGANTNGSSLDDLICPNPIIINSSGIEGIFDIQRVIVTMIDREKLLRQVARATSPKQKISGWCTVSTGFANVVVNFACEQHVLRAQLDVEQAVEDRIVREDRAKKIHNDLQLSRTKKSKEDGLPVKEDQPSEADNVVKKRMDSWKPTKEEQTIVRIIDFIQEPQLQLVAGEWVLARFSGAPGSKWFLCYLELGATHAFYGRRIATTEIDFDNSAVEPGLVKVWEAYMERKKNKMCKILNMFIKSSSNAAKSQERLKKTSDIAAQNYERLMDAKNQSLERVMSMGSPSSSMLKLPFYETTKDEKPAEDSDSDDEEDSGKGFLDDILDQGKEAATALGEYTVLAAYEKLFEMQAKHLDKHLATSVLKRTPKSLQTAVESVDENKGFLPAMFHSSRRVHMF
ncbi:vegetative incompatibility het-E-1 [Fusarium heterosporum]|uniref:Vegetative incompatibility het-E-1 n=1 Tax=Fusarium heterosporum TaxID=42747 RepID=A0A8H5WJI1_FUSHE|nr:vegetative incompatibility het-E-1 [Fusarium heterosporum]